MDFAKAVEKKRKDKMMEALFRKLTANDVEARVQSADENGFVLLIYKNARVDQNILDETFTPFGWQNKYEEVKGNLYCSIGIKTEYGDWIWKSNCGTESYTEKEKGEASDAFKRAGFNWGIGRELYTSPKIKIKGHTVERNGKYVPEYYSFDVVQLEVSDELPRRITALTIMGKSMQGGYHEDCVFEWWDKTPVKVEPEKVKIICAGCGGLVVDTPTRSGELWEATSIKKYSERRFGKCLCAECIKKVSESKKGE
jgi:hypothetical protein